MGSIQQPPHSPGFIRNFVIHKGIIAYALAYISYRFIPAKIPYVFNHGPFYINNNPGPIVGFQPETHRAHIAFDISINYHIYSPAYYGHIEPSQKEHMFFFMIAKILVKIKGYILYYELEIWRAIDGGF